MKHRRGIDLGRPRRDEIVYLGPLDEPRAMFSDLPQWHAIGAHRPKCERIGWMLSYQLARKWGPDTAIGPLAGKLLCRSCGNRAGNKWVIGKLPR